MIETFKILAGLYDAEVTDGFFIVSDRDQRINPLRIKMTHARTDLKKYSFTHRVANSWNKLPAWVVNSESVKAFERNLDKHWCNHPLRHDHQAIRAD